MRCDEWKAENDSQAVFSPAVDNRQVRKMTSQMKVVLESHAGIQDLVELEDVDGLIHAYRNQTDLKSCIGGNRDV
jgi:hypothetical protein